MSVPGRYSATAEFAFVDVGLSNSLQQEGQYHNQIHQHQQLYNLNLNYNCNEDGREYRCQQQFMQQQSLILSPGLSYGMSSSSSSSSASSSLLLCEEASTSLLQKKINNCLMMTTKTKAGSTAETANSSDIAEVRTVWMSDGGRYRTPDAAEQEHQILQQTTMKPLLLNNGNENNAKSSKQQQHQVNLENELNSLSSDDLFNTLNEYNALQDKYHTVLLLPKESKREVTAGGRDGSAYVLRCLKMWYELPSDVIFSAMSLVDRFLDRMAVKPKHMACLSVASFHLAIKQLGLKPIPAEDLVTISQCGCTAGDLERMAGVIANKLGVQICFAPITSVSYLRIYYALFRNMAKELVPEFFEFHKQYIKLEELENRLEILLCDVKTTVISPSTLALVLICLHLDFHIKLSYTKGSPELKHVFEYILFLQKFMRIPDRVFTCGFSIVSGILSHYNGQNKQPYKQRLVWKLSSRTLRLLRPTNRFCSDLPTIQEGISHNMDDGCRSRTESMSSEEEEDWPTSEIIPIFEQC